jgi:hypothetical protein
MSQRREASRRPPGAVGAHVAGVLAFVDGDATQAAAELERALDGLGTTHARVWALTVLAALDGTRGEHRQAAQRAAQAAGLAPAS